MNRLTIELENGTIRQVETSMPADTPEEICEWLVKPMLNRLGFSYSEIDKSFDDDYIKPEVQ